MCRSRICFLSIPVLLLVVAIAGCSKTSVPKEKPTETASQGENGNADAVAGAFASLSEEDRRAVQAQKFCAIEQESLLGSMGEPFKLMIENQPVFLCCEGCREAALKDPKATLAAVDKLIQANSSHP